MRYREFVAILAAPVSGLFAAPVQQILGIHDHYTDPGAFLTRIETGGQVGWVTTSVAVGHNPADMSGDNFNNVVSRGHTVICRINNGYFPDGTIPLPADYAAFAQRCANFVVATVNNMGTQSQSHLWIIGNETNLAVEWPNDGGSNLVYISPADYADCFQQVYSAIKAVRPNDRVLVQALAPYGGPFGSGTLWIYNHPAQPLNWIDYQWQMLTEIRNRGITPDGLAIHAGARGYNPATVFDEDLSARSNSPGLNLAFGSEVLREWILWGCPPEFWSLPLYITETNGLYWWKGGGPETPSDPAYQSGFLQAEFDFIDAWNQNSRWSGLPLYHCANLYRWAPFDDWGIEGYNGVPATQAIYDNILNDAQAVAQARHTVPFQGLPMSFTDPRAPTRSNVALGAAATTDSVSGADVGARALDGNTATRWTSLSSLVPHRLTVDLGAPRAVAGVRVLHAQAGGEAASRNTRLFRVEAASSAAGPWHIVGVGNNRSSAQTSEFTFPSARWLRHLRLFITDAGADDVARIPEFEILAVTQPEEQIIDNMDFNCTLVSGEWQRGTSSVDKHGADYYFIFAGTGANRAEWRPALLDWVYEVQIWYPQGTNRVTDARFTVHHANGSDTFIVNQEINGGQWITLGTFPFDEGTNGRVEVTDESAEAGQVIMADAVRFVPVANIGVGDFQVYR